MTTATESSAASASTGLIPSTCGSKSKIDLSEYQSDGSVSLSNSIDQNRPLVADDGTTRVVMGVASPKEIRWRPSAEDCTLLLTVQQRVSFAKGASFELSRPRTRAIVVDGLEFPNADIQ